MIGLTLLYLADNGLTELQREICNLNNLIKLDLWGNTNLILTQKQKE